jgi:hypothetical protein
VEYIEDNPGRWLYHYHVVDHMMVGMVGYTASTDERSRLTTFSTTASGRASIRFYQPAGCDPSH